MTQNQSGRLASLRDAVFITAATYITTGMGLLVSMIIARDLGPSEYGKYAYLVWMSGFLVICCNHGLGISGIRFVSEYLGRGERHVSRQIHGWLGRWQTVSTILVLLAFAVACWWIPLAGWEDQRPLMLAIVIVGVAAKAAYLFDISIAKGHKLFSVESLTNTVMSLLYAAGVGLLALLDADLTDYAIYFGVVSVLHIVMVRYLMRRNNLAPAHSPCPRDVIARIRPHMAWTVVLIAVATLSNKTLEVFLLGTQIGPAEVGYFTIAVTLTKGGIDVLSSALTAMLMPAMAHAYGEGGHRKVNDILSNAIRYFLFFGLVIGGMGVLWAEPGVALLYGDRYGAVIPALQVMVIVGGLTLPEGAFGALMSTTDHQKLRAGIATVSVVISAATAFLLVPAYGLNGALASVAITRIAIFFGTAAAIRLALHARFPLNHVSRQLLAAVAASVVSWGLLQVSTSMAMQIVSGIAYLVVFVLGTVWLRAWTAEDAAVALSLAERKPAVFGRVEPWLRRWAQGLG